MNFRTKLGMKIIEGPTMPLEETGAGEQVPRSLVIAKWCSNVGMLSKDRLHLGQLMK